MNLKNICLILLLIGALTIGTASAGLFGSDPVQVTVDGVDFELADDAEIIIEEDKMAGFKIDNYIKGYIESINDNDLNTYIQNDTEHGYMVSKLEPESKGIDKYSFVDDGNEQWGYFLVFKKDNKQFIYQVLSEDYDSDLTLGRCSSLIGRFPTDNGIYEPL